MGIRGAVDFLAFLLHLAIYPLFLVLFWGGGKTAQHILVCISLSLLPMYFRQNFWMSSSRANCTECHLGRTYGLRIALPHSYLIDRFDTVLGKSTNARTPPEKLAGSIMQSSSSKKFVMNV